MIYLIIIYLNKVYLVLYLNEYSNILTQLCFPYLLPQYHKTNIFLFLFRRTFCTLLVCKHLHGYQMA